MISNENNCHVRTHVCTCTFILIIIIMIIVLFSAAHFPNAEGVIAPGMTCTYSVKFFPDSLADFEDEIKVSLDN